MVLRSSGLFTLHILAACAFLCGSGCATHAPTTAPDSGVVTVGVTTNGRGIAGLTFHVEIPATGATGTVKADAGIFTARNVPNGKQIVKLTGLPGRCRVDGGPERTVTVSRDRTAAVRFVVTCSDTASFL